MPANWLRLEGLHPRLGPKCPMEVTERRPLLAGSLLCAASDDSSRSPRVIFVGACLVLPDNLYFGTVSPKSLPVLDCLGLRSLPAMVCEPLLARAEEEEGRGQVRGCGPADKLIWKLTTRGRLWVARRGQRRGEDAGQPSSSTACHRLTWRVRRRFSENCKEHKDADGRTCA